MKKRDRNWLRQSTKLPKPLIILDSDTLQIPDVFQLMTKAQLCSQPNIQSFLHPNRREIVPVAPVDKSDTDGDIEIDISSFCSIVTPNQSPTVVDEPKKKRD